MLEAIYWSSVTCFSVGFGTDPMNDATRTFNCVYLIIGITATAMTVSKAVQLVGKIQQARRVEEFVAQGVSAELIREIDADRSGEVLAQRTSDPSPAPPSP